AADLEQQKQPCRRCQTEDHILQMDRPVFVADLPADSTKKIIPYAKNRPVEGAYHKQPPLLHDQLCHNTALPPVSPFSPGRFARSALLLSSGRPRPQRAIFLPPG